MRRFTPAQEKESDHAYCRVYIDIEFCPSMKILKLKLTDFDVMHFLEWVLCIYVFENRQLAAKIHSWLVVRLSCCGAPCLWVCDTSGICMQSKHNLFLILDSAVTVNARTKMKWLYTNFQPDQVTLTILFIPALFGGH